MQNDVVLNKIIPVHDYQAINLDIVRKVIEEHLGDFKAFADLLLGI